MAVICTLDIETSGFDKEADHITEIAWTIKGHGESRSLVDRRHYVVGVEQIPEEVIEITGITTQFTDKFGEPLERVVDELLLDIRRTKTKYIAAHNGNNFDKPFLAEKDPRTEALPHWLDTLTDINWPNSFRCHQLGHLATEFGFINPFPHNALSDVWTTAKLLDQFDLGEVVKRSRSPMVTIFADVNFHDKELAKAERFRWEKWHGRTYTKSWIKVMKKCDYDSFNYSFPTKVIDTWV